MGGRFTQKGAPGEWHFAARGVKHLPFTVACKGTPNKNSSRKPAWALI